MKDAPLSNLLRQAHINTKKQLIAFYYSSWQDFLDTDRSTEKYIIFYQGGPIDYGAHVTGPAAQSSAESEYNAAFTAGMTLARFRMLIHEMLKNDPFHRKHLLSYWIASLLCAWLRMVRIPRILGTLIEEYNVLRNGDK